MNNTIPYGKSTLNLGLDSTLNIERILPLKIPAAQNQSLEVVRALDFPVGNLDWSLYSGSKNVVIAINDKTRPVPNHILIQPILEKLTQMGINQRAIKFLIATGTHQPMLREEFGVILPSSIVANYEIISHDCNRRDLLVSLGVTSRGTPVVINKHFFEADLKIVVGNIEPHHFAGFSGGDKTAVIGLGGTETINRNHSMLVLDQSTIAVYEKNPLRQDIEEAGRMVAVDLAVNAILNLDKEIITVLAGAPLSVMQAGVPLSRKYCQVSTKGKYDIVVASPGGYPKDINLYQSQKALSHASLITSDGGVVILVAACKEGTGSASYEKFMQDKQSTSDVFEAFSKMEFRVGPHKAFQFARELKRIGVILVSELDDNLVRRLLMHSEKDLSVALENAIDMIGIPNPRIALMPYATNTIPSSEPL